jgi:hypothetical protein
MANLPLDNQSLRSYAWCWLKYGDTVEPETTYDRFILTNIGDRSDFQVLRETYSLCEALIEAVDADREFAFYRSKVINSFLSNQVDMKKLEDLRKVRDDKFDDYEVLRMLVASDNYSLCLIRS